MDDLINRQAAIEALKRKQDDGKGDLSRFYNTIIQHDIEAIMQLPSSQPKTGKWVDDGDPLMLKCGNCDYGVMRYNNTPFCPNCGAKMEETT